jgi:hypothetical protein
MRTREGLLSRNQARGIVTRYYTKLLPSENRRRLTKIMAFRNQVVEYFNNCTPERFEAIENDRARKLRTDINISLDEVHEMVNAAGISTLMLYDPAPMRGGFAGNVDVLLNIFRLPYLQINPNAAYDHLERAYGIYIRNGRAARFRMFNPFFYLARLLDLLSEIPFAILGAMGFNRGKAEASPLGRIAKIVIQIVLFLAGLFTVLYYLGLMDGVRDAILGRS